MPPNSTEEDSSGYSPKADSNSVQRLFAHIAGGYDLLNRILSFGFDALWRAKLADAVRPFPLKSTSRILDLAAGTLEVSLALAKRYPNRSIVAVDFCHPMLLHGLPKLAKSRNRKIYPVTADARCLPLPDASVDAITIAFGLRNIRPREEAYAEALRVLTPGGKLCVLEFGSAQDRILFGTYNFYLQHILPKIGRFFSKDKAAYTYLAETVVLYPGAETLSREMQTAGFSKVHFTRYTGGIVVLHIGEKPV